MPVEKGENFSAEVVKMGFIYLNGVGKELGKKRKD